jgi:hypothetical protein
VDAGSARDALSRSTDRRTVCQGSARWRETGAKEGDFPLQTAMIGSQERRVDTKKSITYFLRRPFVRFVHTSAARDKSPVCEVAHTSPEPGEVW